MSEKVTIKQPKEDIIARLSHLYGISPKEATDEQFYEVLAGISREELAKLIESSVERRVAPLRAMLAAEAERGPGMTEILGGIGWILGIFGTAALCLSRRGH